MADLGSGSPLADIKSTTTQATAAPAFYTDYLNNIAKQGQAAVQGAQYVGTQPLQQQAYNLAGSSIGATQPYVQQAGSAITNALGANIPGAAQPYMQATASPLQQAGSAINTALGTNIVGAAQPYMQATAQPLQQAGFAINSAMGTNIPGAAQKYMDLAAAPTSQTVQNFMNPYTQNVVESIGALGNQNISQNLAPQTTAGIVGAGQFGSQRGANALAQNVANAGVGITGLQAGALQSGYTQALQAAQNQANMYGNLGQIAGQQAGAQGQMQLSGAQAAQNLGAGAQQYNLSDINALSTMGAQQQTNLQNQQLFPLQTLSTGANLLRGYNMPTSVTSTYEGPGQAGQYSASPLSQIAGLGGIVGGLSNSSFGNWLGGAVQNFFK